MRHRFKAERADRLDRVIAAQTKLSRKRASRLIERGGVHVDGKKARFASQPVVQGAVIEVRGAANRTKAPALPVVYRDGDVIVVDKPSGLPSQAGVSGGQTHVYGILSCTERYVGLHHRLDTPASGLLLLTLRKGCNAPMSLAFRDHDVQRDYLAVVLGEPGQPGEEGRWDAPLDGKDAGTRWHALSCGDGMSVLRCSLETGRTHQIRRHAADAGHPIIGDRRHGGAAGRAWPRLALHAWRLRFPQPTTDTMVQVDADLPADLVELLASAGYPPEG